MGYDKQKIEGGSGGKRGHSQMDHWQETEIIKHETKKFRRHDEKRHIRDELKRLGY